MNFKSCFYVLHHARTSSQEPSRRCGYTYMYSYAGIKTKTSVWDTHTSNESRSKTKLRQTMNRCTNNRRRIANFNCAPEEI